MSDSTPSNSSNLKAKIFWIDDDPNLLALVHQKLKNDFNIVSFLNPFDCLDRIEEESPSLIVIDLQMPNFSGTELVAQIKNHPLMNMVPIACTSSEITEHQKNEIDRLGVEVFLKKPYNFSSLARALNDLLHNLNKTIKSNDKRMFVTICYNENEKKKLIDSRLNELLESEGKVVFISWRRGEQFKDELHVKNIENNNLVFLEINPTVMSKLAYLQDLSPIFEDIQMLVGEQDLRDYSLVLDEPTDLYRYGDHERSIGTTIALSKYIQTTFDHSYTFITKSQEAEKDLFLLKISKIYSGYGI